MWRCQRDVRSTDETPGGDDGGEHAAKAYRSDYIDTIVEGKARRHMIGAHHEGDEQQGDKGCAGQRF